MNLNQKPFRNEHRRIPCFLYPPSYDRFTIWMICCQMTHWNSSGCYLGFFFHENPCHVKVQQIHNFMNADSSIDFKRTVRRNCEALFWEIWPYNTFQTNDNDQPYIFLYSIHKFKMYKMAPLKTITGIKAAAEWKLCARIESFLPFLSPPMKARREFFPSSWPFTESEAILFSAKLQVTYKDKVISFKMYH